MRVRRVVERLPQRLKSKFLEKFFFISAGPCPIGNSVRIYFSKNVDFIGIPKLHILALYDTVLNSILLFVK